MRTKLIITVFILSSYFGIAQISIAYIAGVYDVNITEWNCTPLTHYQAGLLYLTPNAGCLVAKDSSYTTNLWFNSSIVFSVTTSDSSFHGCTNYNLASGKYFQHDSIHLYLYLYFGTQCSHEYFGKRKLFTGIEDLKLLNNLITIYPQPANDILRITNPNKVVIKTPVMYDINSRLMNIVFAKEDDGNYRANTDEFAPGIYFLNIETTAGVLWKKVVVQH